MKLMKYMLMVMCLSLTFSLFAQEKTEANIIVATYAYKGLDREAAVQPIADALAATIKQNTKVTVYDSPTQLAEAFFSGEAQVIVPNLAGFAQIAAKFKDGILLFVPNDEGSTYKSSIVMSSGSSSFEQSLHSDKKNIGMVWADSTSGAILGMAQLQKQIQSGKPLTKDRIVYLGSHSNVLNALLAGEVEIGVLATDVYLKQESNLVEVWRSHVIPFGPVVCNNAISEQCYQLQQTILDNAEIHHQVLQHLKNGWPEFRTSQALTIPEYKTYEAFIKHFETVTNE